MAGHSKWANTKHRKARADQKRGKIFSRIIKELLVAVKGGTDPNSNFQLRSVLEKAKMANIPKDVIDRNIKKSKTVKNDFEEVHYEFYGYGAIAFIISVFTNNKNRALSDIRSVLHKRNLKLSSAGAVSHMFSTKARFLIEEDLDEDTIFKYALEWGVEDVDSDTREFTVDLKDFSKLNDLIKDKGWHCSSSIEKVADMSMECSDENRSKNEELLDALNEIDDVDVVSHQMNY